MMGVFSKKKKSGKAELRKGILDPRPAAVQQSKLPVGGPLRPLSHAMSMDSSSRKINWDNVHIGFADNSLSAPKFVEELPIGWDKHPDINELRATQHTTFSAHS